MLLAWLIFLLNLSFNLVHVIKQRFFPREGILIEETLYPS